MKRRPHGQKQRWPHGKNSADPHGKNVVPAKAGIQGCQRTWIRGQYLDPRLRGDDVGLRGTTLLSIPCRIDQRPVPLPPEVLVAPGVVPGAIAPVPVLAVPGADVLVLVVPEPLGMVDGTVDEPAAPDAPVLPLIPLEPDELFMLPDWPLVPELEPLPPAPLELLEPLVPMLPLLDVPPLLEPDELPLMPELESLPVEPLVPLEPLLLLCFLACFFLECLVDELPDVA